MYDRRVTILLKMEGFAFLTLDEIIMVINWPDYYVQIVELLVGGFAIVGVDSSIHFGLEAVLCFL